MINYNYKLILYTHLVVIQKLLYIKGVEMVVQIREVNVVLSHSHDI